MGFSKKALKIEGVFETEGKKWVINGSPIRSPLKPIFTNRVEKKESEEEDCTTPTSEESRIPRKLSECPAPPRKRKASSKYNYSKNGREFFSSPELETLFMSKGV